MTELPILSLDEVGFAYPNGLRAIEAISCAIAREEIVAVIGPSGSGKSTLLRIIAGLEQPTNGDVRKQLRGHDDDGQTRHPCTMVFQEDTLLPWLKVRQNVALAQRFRRPRGVPARTDVDDLLRLVGLEQFGDYYPARLSGGMKRRVALLTAIAPLPEIVLFDEPFSALDEPTRIAVHNELHELIRRFAITAVLVTHDLAEAITLADRIVLISRRPARVVKEYPVPFGRDRDMFELRDRDEYLSLYGAIWHDLRTELRSDAKAS